MFLDSANLGLVDRLNRLGNLGPAAIHCRRAGRTRGLTRSTRAEPGSGDVARLESPVQAVFGQYAPSSVRQAMKECTT